MAKPKLPSVASVEAAYAALGVAPVCIEDLVFDGLVSAWRKTKKRPRIDLIARALGVSETAAHRALNKLRDAGLVLTPSRGVWVPVV